MSLTTHPSDILRATQEAIAYRFAAVFDLLGKSLPAPSRVVGSGGALLNTPGWMQMLSDVLGNPVTSSPEEEASSKGAAMIALRALGRISDFSGVPASFGSVFQPDKSRHTIYRKAMERQQEFYEATEGEERVADEKRET
jgi:gluconokinase